MRIPFGNAVGRLISWAETAHPVEQASVPWLATHFKDDVRWLSGWHHDFACPECASMLHFEPDVRRLKEGLYQCPQCGCEATGEAYDAAWVYQYRQWYAQQLVRVAAHPSNKRAAVRYLIRYIDFYANNYAEFPIHGTHAGQGKVMAQSLDEAVFGIHLIRAVYHCKNLIPEERLLLWKDQLFIPMVELLEPHARDLHNIPLWIRCFMGMVGLLYRDEELVGQAMNGRFGILKQLDTFLTADHLWAEGSLHYHYYALEALTYLCELCCFAHQGVWLLPLLEKMYLAPLRLSPDGYSLPSNNDGWYPLTLGSYGAQIACASLLTGSEEIARQVETISRHKPELLNDPGYVALKSSLPQSNGLLFDGHMGVICEPLHITLKSGPLVPKHAHRDCLSIAIEPFSRDLGTTGYGSSINDAWYRETLSHNTVSIDGGQSGGVPSSTVRALKDGLEAELFSVPDSDIVNATRRLTCEGSRVLDDLTIECAASHVFDWTLHLQGNVVVVEETAPAELPGEAEAYHLFEHVERVDATESLHVRCTADDGSVLDAVIGIDEGMQAFVALTPDNPAARRRTTVLVRAKGRKALFRARYCLIASDAESGAL